MHLLCSSINNAMSKNFIFVDVNKKKKYIEILVLLKNYNCINNFVIFKNYIRVFLRYFNNKPIFFLKLISTSSYNKFFSYECVKKVYKNINYNLYFTNKGTFCNEKCLWFKSGGKLILQISFFSKNL